LVEVVFGLVEKLTCYVHRVEAFDCTVDDARDTRGAPIAAVVLVVVGEAKAYGPLAVFVDLEAHVAAFILESFDVFVD
jgi:hypothetical protein